MHTGALKCGPHNFPTDRTRLFSRLPGIRSLLRATPIGPTLTSSPTCLALLQPFSISSPSWGLLSANQPQIGSIRLTWPFSSQELCIFTHSCRTPDVLRLHESVRASHFFSESPLRSYPVVVLSSQGASGLHELCCVIRHCHLLAKALNLVPRVCPSSSPLGLVVCIPHLHCQPGLERHS